MARLRGLQVAPDAASGAGVPLELLDKRHPVWSDAARFEEWLIRHDVPSSSRFRLRPVTWAERFQWAAREWAKTKGFDPVRDHQLLRDLGIPECGSLDRARARSEMDLPLNQWGAR